MQTQRNEYATLQNMYNCIRPCVTETLQNMRYTNIALRFVFSCLLLFIDCCYMSLLYQFRRLCWRFGFPFFLHIVVPNILLCGCVFFCLLKFGAWSFNMNWKHHIVLSNKLIATVHVPSPTFAKCVVFERTAHLSLQYPCAMLQSTTNKI